ncbi:hypothetical protein [Candidatus Leptofilum sp.]|uniref:hypothetical protein n=1 Tax=Candidatus Leptofilum sp. TaxID=3241576 RepID=UPI003B5968B1
MKHAQQAILNSLHDFPKTCADYIYALVLNEIGDALVFELPREGGSGVHWQMLSVPFSASSDPFTAVQTALLHKTGYKTSHWSYLGTHIMTQDESTAVGYYFCAKQAHQIADPRPNGSSPSVAKWVPLTDLRYALLDGRILLTSHALTASLALLTLHK